MILLTAKNCLRISGLWQSLAIVHPASRSMTRTYGHWTVLKRQVINIVPASTLSYTITMVCLKHPGLLFIPVNLDDCLNYPLLPCACWDAIFQLVVVATSVSGPIFYLAGFCK